MECDHALNGARAIHVLLRRVRGERATFVWETAYTGMSNARDACLGQDAARILSEAMALREQALVAERLSGVSWIAVSTPGASAETAHFVKRSFRDAVGHRAFGGLGAFKRIVLPNGYPELMQRTGVTSRVGASVVGAVGDTGL